MPCQNCTARNEQASCKFRGSKQIAATEPGRDHSGDEMRRRIDHLENLVKQLIAQRQGTPSHRDVEDKTNERLETDASDGLDAAGAGKTLIDGVHSMYLSGNEWQVVLQEV